LAIACSELKPSVTTLVLEAEVTRFCSNLTVSEDEELAAVAVEMALWPTTGGMLLTTSVGLVRHTFPVAEGGGGGVSGSGKVTSGSGLVHPTPLPSSRSRFSIELRRRLKFIGLDRFFISEMLDFSSERSDFIDEAFISLEDVTWCTLWEDEEEQEDLATRELELLACSI
jgi:hypothetical protein